MSRVTDYEIVRWLLDGAKESAEADYDVEVTDELMEAWAEFSDAVWEVLDSQGAPLSEDDLDQLESYVDDSAALDVYHTITGAGVDVADGRWDGYLGGGNNQAKDLARWLRGNKKLAEYADDSGAGKLNDAFYDAIWEQRPRSGRASTRRSMQRRKQPKKNPSATIRKYLRGI